MTLELGVAMGESARKAVVILDSLLIVRRSALPRRDDLRTWFRATGLHQRVWSRRSIVEQTTR